MSSPNAAARVSWIDANQRYLSAWVDVVRALLAVRAATDRGRSTGDHTARDSGPPLSAARRSLERARAALPSQAALDALGDALDLSSFEPHVLVLCAGVELEGT